MADQNITTLPVTQAPEPTDQLLLIGAAEERLIDYNKLADAVLNKLASKTFALDQGVKTLLAALNELNSKSRNAFSFDDYTNTKPNGIYSKDFNDFTKSGIYRVGTGNANAPIDWGFLFVFSSYDQIAQIQLSLNAAIYIRIRFNSKEWEKWKILSLTMV